MVEPPFAAPARDVGLVGRADLVPAALDAAEAADRAVVEALGAPAAAEEGGLDAARCGRGSSAVRGRTGTAGRPRRGERPGGSARGGRRVRGREPASPAALRRCCTGASPMRGTDLGPPRSTKGPAACSAGRPRTGSSPPAYAAPGAKAAAASAATSSRQTSGGFGDSGRARMICVDAGWCEARAVAPVHAPVTTPAYRRAGSRARLATVVAASTTTITASDRPVGISGIEPSRSCR